MPASMPQFPWWFFPPIPPPSSIFPQLTGAGTGIISSIAASQGTSILTAQSHAIGMVPCPGTVGKAIKKCYEYITNTAAGRWVINAGQRVWKWFSDLTTRQEQWIRDTVRSAFGGGGTAQAQSKRDKLMNSVQNSRLSNAVNEIYRPGATFGDGGLAAAVRHELATGQLIGGKSHIQKASERITNLENIIRTQTLSPSDTIIANEILSDLKNALGR